MEFVLVFLVPRTSILGRGDLAGLVVFDVGPLRRTGRTGAWGVSTVTSLASEGFLYLCAERHVTGSLIGGSG
jgi:hypothetical protein